MDFDIAVIGAGLIGSAAAFALAEHGQHCALIGPEEPLTRAIHTGPYGSHHDAGRITRALSADPYWAKAAQASIARYREIEQRSGHRFFTPCGAAMVGPQTGPGADFTQAVETTAKARGLPHQRLTGAALQQALPDYAFPEGSIGLFEPTEAGMIDPRMMLCALERLTVQAGGARLTHPAQHLRPIPGGIEIHCPHRPPITAERVIVATGAYGTETLLPQQAPLRRLGRTVLMIDVTGPLAGQLAAMPAVIWQPPSDGVEYYILPPARYRDGRLRVKIGGDPHDRVLHSLDEINAWFRGPGDAATAAHLFEVIRGLVPALAGCARTQLRHAACVTSFTPDGQPLITRAGAVTLALGGCGAAAKSAIELGRRAAELACA